ncbi:partitioning defective 6 homolog beta [Mastomys coucha]|uniref:partitioning defective 6 homolog beta n=1 Tax=Mastomys coucha TaxID=35658 RepID=UPI001261ECAF|nr:partitioning defective 6 homolog beta [Mastomys coucha]
MNRGHRHGVSSGCLGTMEVKSKFGAEFRRFSLERSKPGKFEEFYGLLQHVHKIPNVDVLVGYADIHGDLLPINNDDNYHKAVSTANPLLRIFIQKKGKCHSSSTHLRPGQNGFSPPQDTSLVPVPGSLDTEPESRAPVQKLLEEDGTVITL